MGESVRRLRPVLVFLDDALYTWRRGGQLHATGLGVSSCLARPPAKRSQASQPPVQSRLVHFGARFPCGLQHRQQERTQRQQERKRVENLVAGLFAAFQACGEGAGPLVGSAVAARTPATPLINCRDDHGHGCQSGFPWATFAMAVVTAAYGVCVWTCLPDAPTSSAGAGSKGGADSDADAPKGS